MSQKDAGEQRRVDGPAVDHHEKLVGQRRVEAARADRPVVRVRLRHLQIVGQAQHLRQARGAGALDLILRDDLNRRGCLQQLLWMARDGRHLDAQQLIDAQVFQILDRGGIVVRAGCRQAAEDREQQQCGGTSVPQGAANRSRVIALRAGAHRQTLILRAVEGYGRVNSSRVRRHRSLWRPDRGRNRRGQDL